MKKLATVVLLFGMFIGFGMHQARAQAQVELGPRLGFDLAGNIEELFIGADARIVLPAFPVILNGAVDYYFADLIDLWQLNLNALYEFGIDNASFDPYVGAGIGISRVPVDLDQGIFGGFDDSTTDFGLNLIGGATFGLGNLKPFAQAQITFGDVELFTLAGGILFRIGG